MPSQVSPSLSAARRSAIARIVAQSGAARVVDLVQRFGVNAATIRRDLNELERQGLLRRVHGGAVAVEPGRFKDAAAQATRIGRAAAEILTDGETVFLGPGPLVLQVAYWLADRPQMTIITNGLEIAHWIATHTHHNLIVTGGQAEGSELGLVGHLTRTALSSLRADHVVLELGGVSAVEGLTDDSLAQAEIAQLLLGTGAGVIILVPVERVGRVAAAYIAPASDADAIVTAREAPSPALWDLTECGVRVVLA